MSNLVVNLIVVVQIIMAVFLGVLAFRNGRNGGGTYQVASESSRIVELAGNASAAPPKDVELYRGIPFDEHLLELDKRALEEAYHAHLIRLWNVWLSDGARSATNIKNGLKISREAYHQAAAEIKRREQQLQQESR